MINYEEAIKLIKSEFKKIILEIEEIEIDDAINRTLAENIVADVNLPSFDNSAVDGIAIKYDSTVNKWKINSEVSAGNYSIIANSDAVLIMTGAKIPPQFDTVIPLEDYNIENQIAYLKENLKVRHRANIRPKASDISKNEVVVQEGTFITPRNIAAIAACGRPKIKVFKKLKIGVLATGDELIPIDEKPSLDKLRVSNNYGLTSAVNSTFQTGINFGFVKDNYDLTKAAIKKLLEEDLDVLLTTGGVSVGKYDFVKDIFVDLGVKEIFWRANIKPGKPAFFGTYKMGVNNKLVFGLPGNPVSCMVNFDVYLKPNISNLFGMPQAISISAELQNNIKKKDGKRHFVRGKLTYDKDKYRVTSDLSQSSGNLVGFSNSNCLIELTEEIRNPIKGEIHKCILI